MKFSQRMRMRIATTAAIDDKQCELVIAEQCIERQGSSYCGAPVEHEEDLRCVNHGGDPDPLHKLLRAASQAPGRTLPLDKAVAAGDKDAVLQAIDRGVAVVVSAEGGEEVRPGACEFRHASEYRLAATASARSWLA